MRLFDRIVAWNARQAQHKSVVTLFFKAIVGFLLAGVLLAVIVPPLHSRGVPLRSWMIWSVMALTIGACIGPDLYHRYHRRALK